MSDLTILHGCRTLQLTRGMNTLIDEADFEIVGHFKWNASGSPGHYYATRMSSSRGGVERSIVFLHKALVLTQNKIRVDHRNGDSFDNRRKNLRPATDTQNQYNTHKPLGKSKFKGVNQRTHATNWRSYIRVDGKKTYLGTFPTEEQAARAYDIAAKKHFGEFACTNVDIYGPY